MIKKIGLMACILGAGALVSFGFSLGADTVTGESVQRGLQVWAGITAAFSMVGAMCVLLEAN